MMQNAAAIFYLTDCYFLLLCCVKGKDVNLYSASTCLQDSSNAHFVTETEPPGSI